jgi:hypothetical protein
MTSNQTRFHALVAIAAISMGIAGLCAAESIASHWRTREIRVDGVNDEWQDTIAFEAISIGAINDDQFLYVVVITSDQQRRRQLATSGLTVWLDGSGGKKQSFGIKLPGAGTFVGAGASRRGRVDGSSSDGGTPAADVQAPALTYFEVLGPGKDDRRRVERVADSGIEVAADAREGTLVIELKVPLAKTATHPYAIGTDPGRKIGLGLETAKVERPQFDARGGGSGIGGRRGGRGGGGLGRSGARGGGDERGVQALKPLKVWTTIQLSNAPG